MNYSKNKTRRRNRRKQFVAWGILFLIGLSIGMIMVSGIIHIFCCRCVSKVEATAIVQSYEEPEPELEPEPEPEIISLGEYKLTAYCPCEDCSEGWGNSTSTGAIATQGRTVAVDPKVIPYGTKIVIDGHEHEYIAEDCGGAIKGNRIDVYFDSHQEALEFGVQHKEVFVKGDL